MVAQFRMGAYFGDFYPKTNLANSSVAESQRQSQLPLRFPTNQFPRFLSTTPIPVVVSFPTVEFILALADRVIIVGSMLL